MAADWDPAQYDKFAAERRQPFDELLGLLRPVPGGRVADLGCGPGTLTVDLGRALGAQEVVGVDNSR
jgi:trans-aconitate 2-methyltransferase